jgi:hypothetical protein
MKVFEEMHGRIFTSEEEKKISEEYSRFLDKYNKKLSKTEVEIDNKGDILDDNNSEFLISICKNKTHEKKLLNKQNEITKDSSTFLGRKTKNLTGTGTHGADAKDNQRDRKIQYSVAYLRELASGECTKCNFGTFDEPNIKDQFGSNFVQNMSFLNTKLYKILCFQKDFKNDNITNHRNKCLKNKKIIMEMLGKENKEFFVFLMKAKLLDYEEIGEKIKTYLSLDENNEKLNEFKNKIKSLTEEIESKLKESRKKENKTIDYITIEELED